MCATMATGRPSEEQLKVISRVRTCLLASVGSIPLDKLSRDYITMFRSPLPYRNLGYSTLEEYLQSIPDVVRLKEGSRGQLIVEYVIRQSKQHTNQIVGHQSQDGKNSRSIPGPSVLQNRTHGLLQSAVSKEYEGAHKDILPHDWYSQNEKFVKTNDTDHSMTSWLSLSSNGNLKSPACASTQNGGETVGTHTVRSLSSNGNLKYPTCGFTQNGGDTVGTHPDRSLISNRNVKYPTCGFTQNSGDTVGTHTDRSLSSNGILRYPACASTQNGGETVGTHTDTSLSSNGILRYPACASTQNGSETVGTHTDFKYPACASTQNGGENFGIYPDRVVPTSGRAEIQQNSKLALEALELAIRHASLQDSCSDPSALLQEAQMWVGEDRKTTGLGVRHQPAGGGQQTEALPNDLYYHVEPSPLFKKVHMTDNRGTLQPLVKEPFRVPVVDEVLVPDNQLDFDTEHISSAQMQLDLLPFPDTEFFDVFVTSVSDNLEVYFRLADDISVDAFHDLYCKIDLHYMNGKGELVISPEEGFLYIAKLEGEWLRVLILSQSSGDEVSCWLVDHGDEDTVHTSDLRQITPEFAAVPFQEHHQK